MTAEPSTWTSHRWTWGLIVVAGLAAAGVYHFWQSKRNETTDNETTPEASAPLPPLTASPFLNTRPGVAFVGDQRCVSCHRDQSRSYRQHSMGRSLFTAADAPRLESYDAGANSHFQAGPFHFQSVRQGNRLVHKEWCQDASGNVVAKQEVDIDYAIGSGTHAYSYLWQRDGFMFQSPITWFSTDSKWRVAPGYRDNQQHFARPIDRRCLYCHCDQAYHIDDTINRYREPLFRQLAIGCERCHGPGELHVASRLKGPLDEEVDKTIVNPKHLSPALREAVCEQCHLQGEAIVARRGREQTEFRPGLPLHEYFHVFVTPDLDDGNKIVGHVEQMHQSACFKGSAGNFGCTSCHDPHGLPAKDEAAAYYRQRCTDCHAARPQAPTRPRAVRASPCSVSLARRKSKNGDNCVACHMPSSPSSNVSHVALSDHRVVRNPQPAGKADSSRAFDLVPFHRDSTRPDDPEVLRDQGVALMFHVQRLPDSGAEEARAALSRRALELLDEAVKRAPDDLPALDARAAALFEQGYRDEALQTLERALARSPRREESLAAAALVAQLTNKLEEAEVYAKRLLQANPRSAAHHSRLASILAARKAWQQSIREAEESLRLNPFEPAARGILIIALLGNGERDRAMAEFKTLGIIDPEYRERIWAEYQRKMGQGK